MACGGTGSPQIIRTCNPRTARISYGVKLFFSHTGGTIIVDMDGLSYSLGVLIGMCGGQGCHAISDDCEGGKGGVGYRTVQMPSTR
eukprot:767580-Hanusia_phi.AAC.4